MIIKFYGDEGATEVYDIKLNEEKENAPKKNIIKIETPKEELAIDFDGPVHRASKGWQGDICYDMPTQGVEEALKELEKEYRLTLFTARKEHSPVIEWLDIHGLKKYFERITNIKPAAKYIDDNALRFASWDTTLKNIPQKKLLKAIVGKDPFQMNMFKLTPPGGKPKGQVGETRQFGTNDLRRLEVNKDGKKRWVDADKDDEKAAGKRQEAGRTNDLGKKIEALKKEMDEKKGTAFAHVLKLRIEAMEELQKENKQSLEDRSKKTEKHEKNPKNKSVDSKKTMKLNMKVKSEKPEVKNEKKGSDLFGENGKEKIEDFGEKIGGARKDMGITRTVRKISDGKPAWMKKYAVIEDANGKYEVMTIKKLYGMNISRTVGKDFDTREEAENAIPIYEVAKKHGVREVKENEYEVYRRVSDRKRTTIKGGFKTEEEAKKYLVTNAIQIINTKFNNIDDLPHLEFISRKGDNYRTGDVSTEKFHETFGFRGVEFGEWLNQLERQEVLNHAFDGLMDLANILNIEPAMISLNGELAAAFGSRGAGLSSAKAHYEPGKVVFNLTRIKGAGSLAHEWFHALDHYVAKRSGKVKQKDSYKEREDIFVSHGFGYYGKKAREELRASMDALMDTMQYKMDTIVRDKTRFEKILNRRKEALEYNINNLRTEISQKKDWGRKKAAATDEQMKRFENLADKIRNGDLGENITNPHSKAYVSRNGTVPKVLLEMSNLYKEVRGRAGWGDYQYMDVVHGSLRQVEWARKDLEEVNIDPKKRVKVKTNFVVDANDMDMTRTKTYWSYPHELAARAFSAYCQDKIEEQGGESQYLVHSAENHHYLFNPFPEGEERKSINGAFDKFFSVLRGKGDRFFVTDEEYEQALGNAKKELKKGFKSFYLLRKSIETNEMTKQQAINTIGTYHYETGWKKYELWKQMMIEDLGDIEENRLKKLFQILDKEYKDWYGEKIGLKKSMFLLFKKSLAGQMNMFGASGTKEEKQEGVTKDGKTGKLVLRKNKSGKGKHWNKMDDGKTGGGKREENKKSEVPGKQVKDGVISTKQAYNVLANCLGNKAVVYDKMGKVLEEGKFIVGNEDNSGTLNLCFTTAGDTNYKFVPVPRNQLVFKKGAEVIVKYADRDIAINTEEKYKELLQEKNADPEKIRKAQELHEEMEDLAEEYIKRAEEEKEKYLMDIDQISRRLGIAPSSYKFRNDAVMEKEELMDIFEENNSNNNYYNNTKIPGTLRGTMIVETSGQIGKVKAEVINTGYKILNQERSKSSGPLNHMILQLVKNDSDRIIRRLDIKTREYYQKEYNSDREEKFAQL